jgi:ABC-type amino acid transport system permease subunit
LFGDRESASRYILAGVMGWFLHDAVMDFMFIPTNLPFFLGTRHTTYLYFALRILSGAFLGLIFVLARSRSPHLLRWVAIGSLAYPVVTYLYVRLLFKLFIVETPWLFIALMLLVLLFIGSVFLIALRAGSSRHAPWLVLFGAASILVSQTISGQVINTFFGFLQPELGVVRYFSWSIPLKFAAMDAIYGLFFGLLLGLILGFHRRINSPRLAA